MLRRNGNILVAMQVSIFFGLSAQFSESSSIMLCQRRGCHARTRSVCLSSPSLAMVTSSGALSQALSSVPGCGSIADLPLDTLGIWGGAGFVSGFCTKKMGKATYKLFLLLALGEQLLERNGYVTIHWAKIQRDMTKSELFAHIDKNKDGKISAAELQEELLRWQKMGSGMLQKNIDGLQIGGTALAGGFAAGFFAG